MVELTQEQKTLGYKLTQWFRSQYKQIYIYSGRAGTGKTTVVKYFIDEIGLEMKDVVCCALSGKAVTVLAMHGLQAKTIHSLIYHPILVDATDDDGKVIYKANGDPKQKLVFSKKERLDYDYKLIVVDEVSMVNDELMYDLLSFGVPVVGMGDHNQLPPIFGISSFMLHPDFYLTKIMRQAEESPIIYLANRVLDYLPISEGVYGTSRVLRRIELGSNLLRDYDIALCARNITRDVFNEGVRFRLLNRRSREPEYNDRLICRQNEWDRCLKGMYLTNGTTGTIVDIDEEHSNSRKLSIDFAPDFAPDLAYQDVELDRKFITSTYSDRKSYGLSAYAKFEYAYMITAHLSQGSQYPSVLFVDEPFNGDRETRRKLRYTTITRAIDRIDIVLSPAFLAPWNYN